jgi:hypothetical protein
MKSLKQFGRRVVIGHPHDDLVPYCSATIRSCHPRIGDDTTKIEFRVLSDTMTHDGDEHLIGTRHHDNETFGSIHTHRACQRRIQCDKGQLEMDRHMLQEMQNTDFRRITVDFGAQTEKAHTAIIGFEIDESVKEPHEIDAQSVGYITDLITSDLLQ